MLYYTEVCLSHAEVPEESSICIYLSGCMNRCPECHYPELQRTDYGDRLREYYQDIVALYLNQASCVCFLGEGNGADEEKRELISYADYAHAKGLKVCLYSGRDTELEDWMGVFDFIKLGSYQEKYGPLSSPTTNQRFYKRDKNAGYIDITSAFTVP